MAEAVDRALDTRDSAAVQDALRELRAVAEKELSQPDAVEEILAPGSDENGVIRVYAEVVWRLKRKLVTDKFAGNVLAKFTGSNERTVRDWFDKYRARHAREGTADEERPDALALVIEKARREGLDALISRAEAEEERGPVETESGTEVILHPPQEPGAPRIYLQLAELTRRHPGARERLPSARGQAAPRARHFGPRVIGEEQYEREQKRVRAATGAGAAEAAAGPGVIGGKSPSKDARSALGTTRRVVATGSCVVRGNSGGGRRASRERRYAVPTQD